MAGVVLWVIGIMVLTVVVNYRRVMSPFGHIPDQLVGFDNYVKHKRRMLERIRIYTWEEWKQEELEDLEFEVRYAEIAQEVLRKLSKRGELK